VNLTNRLNLPEAIVKAVSADSYSKYGADISVTELLSPVQMRRLIAEHSDEIVEDVSDRIWALFGQAVHHIIEKSSDQADVLAETTLFTEVDGKKIKGTVDHVTISDSKLSDFKVTNARKIRDGVTPSEWVQQTNIYRWMLAREYGLVINAMEIVVFLRDWTKYEAKGSPEYPQAPALTLQVPLWTPEATEDFVRQRLAYHYGEATPGCTDAEVWAKPTRYAVMKAGRKTAVRVYDSEEEAKASAEQMGSAHYVETRPGEATRCKTYCPVSQWCPQWAADPRRPVEAPDVASTLFG
jgi:hypothetical protein